MAAPPTTPPTVVPPLREHPDAGALTALAILNYVYAAIIALGGCGGIVWMVIGAFTMTAGATTGKGAAFGVGTIFFFVGAVIVAAIFGLAYLVFLCGQSIQQRKRRTYCIVVSCIQLLSVPVGTAIGIFALIILTKERVAALFEGRWDGAPAPPSGY